MSAERLLIYTPRLRLYGRALASVYAARAAYGRPLDALETQNDQPYGRPGQTPDQPRGNANVLHLYQQARARFLAGPWSHLLCIEDDMVLPEDAIVRLVEAAAQLDAGVVYSLYSWRWGANRDHLWSVYRHVYPDSGASWAEDQPQTIARWARERRRVEVAGVGLGCTLIRRDVLERIDFRDGGRAACDWSFAVDCQAAKVRQIADLGVVCGHIRADPSLRIIWPDLDGQRRPMSRYEYLERELEPAG